MNVIIIGGGKIGFYLAKTLIEHGHAPKIIEKKRTTCEFLANQLDIPIICGDGSTIETMEAARIAEAQAVVCVTGQDQDNLAACQIAKKLYHTPRTVARVNNPKNADVLKSLGVDIPISSTGNIARLLEREIDTSPIKQLISLNGGEASINELQLPDNYALHGKRLMELDLPEECVIVSISRRGDFIIPRGNTQLFSGDKVIIVAQNASLHALKKRLYVQ